MLLPPPTLPDMHILEAVLYTSNPVCDASSAGCGYTTRKMMKRMNDGDSKSHFPFLPVTVRVPSEANTALATG